MRKLSTLVLLALLAAPLLHTSTAQPAPEPELVTICYYGVTLTVSPKIAKRYLKIGATEGACGQIPCGQIPSLTNLNVIPCDDTFVVSALVKPAISENAIQLLEPSHATTKALLSLGTGKLVAGK